MKISLLKIYFVAVLLIMATLVVAQPVQPPGGGPGGGGTLPPGYTALNQDWAVKYEYEGTWVTLSWRYHPITFEVESVSDSREWPPNLMGGAGNSTIDIKRAYVKSNGTIRLKFLWRHLPQAPPPVLRLKMGAGVGVSAFLTNGLSHVDRYELDSGLGLPVVDSSGGGFGKHTPGLVLRKVNISPSGEGEMVVTQKAEIEVVGGYSSCHAVAPSLQLWVDERNASVTKIFGVWPNSKFPGTPKSQNFEFTQDAWPYYPASHRISRVFSWVDSVPGPAPLETPNDCTDSAEWHIGLTTGKHDVLLGGSIDHSSYKSFVETMYIASVSSPVVGDLFRWVVQSNNWRAYDTVGPYLSPRQENYDGIPVNALAHGTAFVPAKFFKIVGPPDAASSFKYDVGLTDNVEFTWTWQDDGLVAISKRQVILHENSEATDFKSDAWLEFNVGRPYTGALADSQDLVGIPNVPGYVDAGVSQCILGEIPPSLQGLGAVLSAVGPAVGIAAHLGIALSPHLLVGFAAAEALGAVISLVQFNDQSFEFQRNWVSVVGGQVDAIEVVDPFFSYDWNGFTHTGNVTADYTNPGKLEAVRSAIASSQHLYYWKAEVRHITEMTYKVHDLWGNQGYQGQTVVPYPKEKPLHMGYYKMTFRSN